jgi:anti-anti-sigma regulatory factor
MEKVAVELSAPDLSPLELTRRGNQLHFVLGAREDILPELPENYEALVAERLAAVLKGPGDWSAEVDLRHVSAISSRQLGALIALQKALRPHVGRVRIVGISGGVRRLLALTHVDQLFDLE